MIPLYDTIHSRSFPFVNWMLIIANVAFFLIEVALGADAEWLVATFGVVPARLLANPDPTRLRPSFHRCSSMEDGRIC
jgi:membrane associated rhomboid family serine protease